ncbi:adam 11 [Lasius niger]|uniref:Adam 11 n=1 Tax=Lasius niger TaxID=67767 RepID=A0A0J7L3H7_LASNI|nr:adam 11 [Lasius niger]
MGISTREVGVSKFPQRGYGDGGYQNPRGRMRTGRHFHRTSLLIKAFNHKFRLDLELNTQLLAPNLIQKDFFSDAEQMSKQEIEHCYYHGTVRDYPGASAAFHTCNGVSGVIHLGNETFVIHPFYGGDLSFDKRNGSTRAEVVHDAIQVANIADLYFRTLNTRVSVIYIETWKGSNQAQIDNGINIDQALLNFNDYTMRRMYQSTQDTTQLLTGETFSGGESGVAVPSTVCSQRSVGISVDLNTYEPHLLAGTMAHMIGHNIGMSHDDGRNDCNCRDWHGCIMAQSIVGLENVQPYKFSECSKTDYIEALKSGHGICLFNKPNELEIRRSCGNRVIDDGEQCDCGSIEECKEYDPCCDAITCKLTTEAECASGPCCSNCKLRARGVVCRESTNECDLPEMCAGDTGQCPPDVYKKNGSPCSNDAGSCFNGMCPALDLQCEQVWGYGGTVADQQCFEQFNSKGSINGHCGTDASGHFVKCEAENVRCGSLQCQQGSKQPVIEGMKDYYSRTIISIKSKEYECKATTGRVEGSDIPGMGLVRDGTSCGDNLACTNVNRCYCYPGWSGPDCSLAQPIPTVLPTLPPIIKGNKSDSVLEKIETPYEGTNNNLSTGLMVVILVGVVTGVFLCFALMAVCYRYSNSENRSRPVVFVVVIRG